MRANIIYRGKAVPREFAPPILGPTGRGSSSARRSPLEIAVDSYGASEALHQRLGDGLHAAHREAPPIHPDEEIESLDIRSSRWTVSFGYRQSSARKTRTIQSYLPYLTMDAGALYGFIRGSFKWTYGGSDPFALEREESICLWDDAIPTVVAHKIDEAAARNDDHITLTIKVLGIGSSASEFRELMRMLLDHLDTEVGYNGWVYFRLIGFDRSQQAFMHWPETHWAKLASLSRDNPLLRDRVCTSFDVFYGDLRHRESLPYMLSFGTPDFAFWRNTHVIWSTEEPNSHGDYIIAGLRDCVASPGAMLVSERGHDRHKFYEQVLV